MKEVIIFISGMFLMFLIYQALGQREHREEEENYSITKLSEGTEETCVTKKDLRIFQVLSPEYALADFQEKDNRGLMMDTTVLLVNQEEHPTPHYDNENVRIPKGKCAKRIGTLKYKTKMGEFKTVPAVTIK